MGPIAFFTVSGSIFSPMCLGLDFTEVDNMIALSIEQIG